MYSPDGESQEIHVQEALHLCIGISTQLKVHILAGISRRGRTRVCEGIMKEELFVSNLDGTLLLFIDEVYPEGHEVYPEGPEFMVDSDPKYTSGYAAGWMRENSANWWNTMSSQRDFKEIWYFPTMVAIGRSVHFGLDLSHPLYISSIFYFCGTTTCFMSGIWTILR